MCPPGEDYPSCETAKAQEWTPMQLKIALASVINKWAIQRAKEESKKKKSKPRKPTAYNIFFREQMKYPAIKRLDHGERMAAVAANWKKLSPAQKRMWVAKAAAQ